MSPYYLLSHWMYSCGCFINNKLVYPYSVPVHVHRSRYRHWHRVRNVLEVVNIFTDSDNKCCFGWWVHDCPTFSQWERHTHKFMCKYRWYISYSFETDVLSSLRYLILFFALVSTKCISIRVSRVQCICTTRFWVLKKYFVAWAVIINC